MAGGRFWERGEGEEGAGEPAGGLGVRNLALGALSDLKYFLFPWELAAATAAIRLREASFARPVKPFSSSLFHGKYDKTLSVVFRETRGQSGCARDVMLSRWH